MKYSIAIHCIVLKGKDKNRLLNRSKYLCIVGGKCKKTFRNKRPVLVGGPAIKQQETAVTGGLKQVLSDLS